MAGLCVVVGGLIVTAAPAVAAAPMTLYAGASATGAGDCSSAGDACTLTAAVAAAASGDVVALVTSGVEGTSSTYYSGGFSIGTAGTSASFPVVIEPALGTTNPILDGGGHSTVLTVTNNMHLVINNVTIQNGSGAVGGGIANEAGGTLTVNGSTLSDNHASMIGGAIDNGASGSGTLSVTTSTFTNNTAVTEGGAIDIGGQTGSGTSTVTTSTFTNNSAQDGGAIDNGDGGSGTLTVNSSTFATNTAVDGGAIDNGDHSGSGALTVTSSTFANNQASTNGAGIAHADNFGSGTVLAAADIFAGSCAIGAGGWTDRGNNVGSDSSCLNGGTGDATAANLASLLGPLANNGGLTKTVRPLAGNPASGRIPNGSGVLCPVAADQTGRPSPIGGRCNAGALQAHPKIKTVAITGSAAAPTLTITGTGLGTKANLGPPTNPCGPNPAGNGFNYAANFYLGDTTNGMEAGRSKPNCDYTGLTISTYTNTKIVFTFGSTYPTFGSLTSGDAYRITLLGTSFNGTVTYPAST
jgi:hypothetical protein